MSGNRGLQIGVGVVAGIIGGIVAGPAGAGFAWSAAMACGTIGLSLGGLLFPSKAENENSALGGTSAELEVQTSSYGTVISVVFGTRKIAGNLIWYGNFQTIPHYTETEQESGGKGGGGGSSTTTSVSYTYSVSLAFGLCMGKSTVLRAWAGKDLVPESAYTIYDGTQTLPDSHIASFTTRDPVWKNLCYVVLPNYDLGGSPHIPNFTFEVCHFGNDGEYKSELDSNSGYHGVVYMSNGFALNMHSSFYLAGGTDYLKVASAKLGSGIVWKDYLTLKSWLSSAGPTAVWYPLQLVKITDTVALVYRAEGSALTTCLFDIVSMDSTTGVLSALSTDNAATDDHSSNFTLIEDSTGGDARVLETWFVPDGEAFTTGVFKGRVHTINKTTGAVTTGTTYTDSTTIQGANSHHTAYISSNNVLIAYRQAYMSYGAGYYFVGVLSVDSSNVVTFGTFAHNATEFVGAVQPIYDSWIDTAHTKILIPIIETGSVKTSYLYVTVSGTTATVVSETRYPDYTAGSSYSNGNVNLVMISATKGLLLCSGSLAGSNCLFMKYITFNTTATTTPVISYTEAIGVTAVHYGTCQTNDSGLYLKLVPGDTVHIMCPSCAQLHDRDFTVTWVNSGETSMYGTYDFCISDETSYFDGSCTAYKGYSVSYVTTNSYAVTVGGDATVDLVSNDAGFGSGLKNNFVIEYNDNYYIFCKTQSGDYELTSFVIQNSLSATDVSPTEISKEILTNDLYGIGLDVDTYLDLVKFTNTGEFCVENDLLMSAVFNKQQSILDVLQYIIQHHNGYIAYENGKISHNQLFYDPNTNVVEYEEKTSFSDDFAGTTIDSAKWAVFGGA